MKLKFKLKNKNKFKLFLKKILAKNNEKHAFQKEVKKQKTKIK